MPALAILAPIANLEATLGPVGWAAVIGTSIGGTILSIVESAKKEYALRTNTDEINQLANYYKNEAKMLPMLTGTDVYREIDTTTPERAAIAQTNVAIQKMLSVAAQIGTAATNYNLLVNEFKVKVNVGEPSTNFDLLTIRRFGISSPYITPAIRWQYNGENVGLGRDWGTGDNSGYTTSQATTDFVSDLKNLGFFGPATSAYHFIIAPRNYMGIGNPSVTHSPTDITNIINTVLGGITVNDFKTVINGIIDDIIQGEIDKRNRQWGQIVGAGIISPVSIPDFIHPWIDDVINRRKSKIKLQTKIKVGTRVASQVDLKREKEEEEEKEEKAKKPKRKTPAKKSKKQLPEKIKQISIDVSGVSEWIAKMIFIFPTAKELRSDDRGTLIFVLKKNARIIKFVRVKRGTFSVIADYYGTGYRLWAQFWKRKIVNKGLVLSWFIKRITEQDRAIGIEREIILRKVNYK